MKPESAASAFNSRKRKANPETQGGGGGESEGEHDEHEAAPDKQQPPDILSSMTLGQLSVCGMEFVARSEHYASLFGFDNDDLETIRMNSIDLKLVQMRLEVFLWDWRPGWVRVASRQSLQLFNCSSLLLVTVITCCCRSYSLLPIALLILVLSPVTRVFLRLYCDCDCYWTEPGPGPLLGTYQHHGPLLGVELWQCNRGGRSVCCRFKAKAFQGDQEN